MLAVLRERHLPRVRHYLYGGAPGVAKQLTQVLSRKYPDSEVVGTYCPPFRPLSTNEQSDLLNHVNDLQPDIMWIGLSTPKQERFMAEYLPRLDTTLMIGVGAAFDFHTGRINDSPDWVKQMGLQWMHRLIQEPSRLWRRYLINNPTFAWNAILQLTGMKTFTVDAVAEHRTPLAPSSGNFPLN